MNRIIKDAIENGLDRRLQDVTSIRPLTGGCINEVHRVEFESQPSVVIKSSSSRYARSMFAAEAIGLELIRQTDSISVPLVLTQSPNHSQYSYLILEFIETSATGAAFWETFGEQLAQLHQYRRESRFGFDSSNFIGSTIQQNEWSDCWLDFFREQRLQCMHRSLRDAGMIDTGFSTSLDRLGNSLDQIITEPSHPSIVHGDLWSGNFVSTSDDRVYLIDPSVAWADREFEFGIMRMFGGFATEFYDAYDFVCPLDSGWQDRVLVYQLYHGLNHWLLFGVSYASQCQAILKRFV